MKVLENSKIQMDIGEKVSYAGRTYAVVRDENKGSLCCGCPFKDREKCPIFACSPLSRDDGKSVVFSGEFVDVFEDEAKELQKHAKKAKREI